MNDIIETIFDHLNDNWVKFVTAGLFMAVGWFFGKRRARAEWHKKEFLGRLNVSLNMIRDGKLLLRTMLEKSCEEIFLNQVAVTAVLEAARHTTAEDPLLPLPKDDYWYYLNSVLNEVAEKFAEGQLRRDLETPARTETYLICLTCEVAGEMKTRKIRAMMIRRKLLENLPTEQPILERPTHNVRFRTLTQLAAAWKATPERFIEMEICL